VINSISTQPTKVYSLQFGLLCLSSFLFFASFNLLIAELPSYLTRLGGGEYKGLIISLFALTAGLSRPFSGKLADKIGRIPVMVIGTLVTAIAAFLYPIVASIAGFFLLRMYHGFSTGFTPTGTSAYVADIIPAAKRGEAMGFLGFFTSLGMAIGPSIGSWIAANYTLNAMFYTSGLFAVASIAILSGMKETLTTKEKLSTQHFNIKMEDVFEPRVVAPAIFMMLCLYAFGTVLTIVPDFSDYLGLSNRGIFFTVFTLSSLLVRFMAGKASDIYGRVVVLKVAALLLSIALLTIAFSTDSTQFLIGAFIFGLGVGAGSPTAFAWTIDLSDDKHRGRGMATMYIALEIGIGMGAFCSGLFYQDDFSKIPLVFGIAAVLAFTAFLYLQVKHTRRS
jgi:MFS family permease